MLGTKTVWKQLQKITQGRVRDRGVTWFPELVDKSEYLLYVFLYMTFSVSVLGKPFMLS